MALNFRTFLAGLRIFPKTTSTSDSQGELEVLSTDGKIYYHNGTTNSPLSTASSTDTLSNKNLVDNSTFIVDNSDATKRIAFDAAGTTGTTTTLTSSQTVNRTITFPDAAGTVALTSGGTLTNTKLDDSTVSFVDTGDNTKQIKFDAGGTTGTSTTLTAAQTANRVLTFPNLTDTLVSRTSTDTLTNKTLDDSTTAISDTSDPTKQIKFDAGGTTGTSSTITGAQTANRVLTLPNVTDTLISRISSDQGANRLKTKDLEGGSVRFVDSTDTTKIISFDPSTAATNTTTQLNTNATTNRVLTLPDATTTLVGTNTSDALSNKTQIDVDNIRLNGNTISSTNTNGNLVLDPDGTGIIDAQSSVTIVGSVRSDTSLILEETGAGTDTITIQSPSSIAASYTLTLPVDDGTSNQVLTTDGSGILSWSTSIASSNFATLLENLSLTPSVAASALTVALKGQDGNDPSGGNIVKIGFRSSTITNGSYNLRSVTSATSIVVPSGATLGLSSGSNGYIFIYALDNAGTVELAVSSIWRDESSVVSTTTIGTGSDDSGIYSTTGRSNVPIRLIGRFKYTTAPNGTYSTVPNEVSLSMYGNDLQLTEYFGAISSTKTPSNSANYLNMSGNSVTLQPGDWDLQGYTLFNNAAATSYTETDVIWCGANGADSGSQPANISTVATIVAPGAGSNSDYNFFALNGTTIGGTSSFWARVAYPIRITVTSTATIYMVPFEVGTAANMRIQTYVYAKRVS